MALLLLNPGSGQGCSFWQHVRTVLSQIKKCSAGIKQSTDLLSCFFFMPAVLSFFHLTAHVNTVYSINNVRNSALYSQSIEFQIVIDMNNLRKTTYIELSQL